jgi:hypothetical protein
MRIISLFFCMVICKNSYTQILRFTKLNDAKHKDSSIAYTYNLELYNNTNIPLCIPVSLSYGRTANLQDTVDLAGIYQEDDSVLVLSLYYSKIDIRSSYTRYPAVPVIVNPGTYFLTNFTFSLNPRNKFFYLDLKVCYQKFDFQKVINDFQNKPQYEWMEELGFIDTKYPIFDGAVTSYTDINRSKESPEIIKQEKENKKPGRRKRF